MKFMGYKIILLFIFLLGSPAVVSAQCAMCRAALETEENQTAAAGINNGITYLMIFPYLIVGIVGYIIYRLVKKHRFD